MKSMLAVIAYGLATLLNAMPHQVSPTYQVSVLSYMDDASPIAPAWQNEDNQRLIPISDKTRKGLVDPVVEEGLFTLLGPRFGNEFYKDVTDDIATSDLTCITKCAGTIATSLPCLFKALADQNPFEALQCVSKSKLCSCAKCLPDALENWINKQICSNSNILDVPESERFSPYVDFSTLSTSSLIIAAFRGDIYNYQVEEFKTISKITSPSSNANIQSSCFPGTAPCGDCCCLGVCVPFANSCLGVCV